MFGGGTTFNVVDADRQLTLAVAQAFFDALLSEQKLRPPKSAFRYGSTFFFLCLLQVVFK